MTFEKSEYAKLSECFARSIVSTLSPYKQRMLLDDVGGEIEMVLKDFENRENLKCSEKKYLELLYTFEEAIEFELTRDGTYGNFEGYGHSIRNGGI